MPDCQLNPHLRTRGSQDACHNAARPGSFREAGFALVEVLGALLVFSLFLALLTSLIVRGNDWLEQTHAAWHLTMVTEAAEDYVDDHAATLAQTASTNAGPEIALATLVQEGYLPDNFAPSNVWNQTCTIHVRALPAVAGNPDDGDEAAESNRIYVVVLTHGGRGSEYGEDDAHFFSVLVPGAARRAGHAAGFVPDPSLPGRQEGTLVGSSGGYVLDLASLGLENPGAGHLGACSAMRRTGTTGDYLSRVAVDGHPEANQMEVSLDMTGHGLVNVGHVELVPYAAEAADRPVPAGSNGQCSEDEVGRMFLDESHGLYLCRRVAGEAAPILTLVADTGNSASPQCLALVADNGLVAKPVCAPDTGTVPRIFVAPAIASSGPESPAMTALRAWATDEETHWRVHLRVKNLAHKEQATWYGAAGEGEDLAPYYGAVQVITACVRGNG